MINSPKRKYILKNLPQNEEINSYNLEENENEEKKKNNIDISEVILNKKQEYDLESNGENYILEIGYSSNNDSILLKIIPLKNKDKENIIIYYESLFSLNELTKLCKSLRMYDSIEEIFSAFCSIFENKKEYIKKRAENDNEDDINSLDLVIVVGSVIGKEDEIILNLSQKQIRRIIEDKKEEIFPEDEVNYSKSNDYQCYFSLKENEIYSRMESIEKEIKEENIELKNKKLDVVNNIDKFKKTVDNNRNEIKNLKTEIKDMKALFEDEIKNLTEKINNININIDYRINNNKNDDSHLNKKEINIGSKENDNNNNNEKLYFNPKDKKKIIQEKKKDNKKEIYQKMKSQNTHILKNKKEKSSFGEFLKQQKSLGNKLQFSIEVKVPTQERKKILQKFNTNNIFESSKINVNQSVNVSVVKNNKFNIENDNETSNSDKNEKENIDNFNNTNLNENKKNNNDIEKKEECDNNKRSDKKEEFSNSNDKILNKSNESLLKLNKIKGKTLNKEEELELIENRLLKNYPDIKGINYTLVYRASDDGDSAEIFHRKCDDIPFTLTIIKSTEGNKFGGFTEETWEGIDSAKKDYNAFCFSLTKNKIYNVINNKNAIICDPGKGPTFGAPLFYIYDNFWLKGGLCFKKDECNYSGQDYDFEITNGDKEFKVEEIEVYRVSFN